MEKQSEIDAVINEQIAHLVGELEDFSEKVKALSTSQHCTKEEAELLTELHRDFHEDLLELKTYIK